MKTLHSEELCKLTAQVLPIFIKYLADYVLRSLTYSYFFISLIDYRTEDCKDLNHTQFHDEVRRLYFRNQVNEESCEQRTVRSS